MNSSSLATLGRFGNSTARFNKRMTGLRQSGNLQPGVVMLLVLFFCIYAGYRSGDFWSVLNWQLLAQPLAEAGLVSLGMMFVIASGGIDLSAGAIIGVAAVTGGGRRASPPARPGNRGGHARRRSALRRFQRNTDWHLSPFVHPGYAWQHDSL